jgi:peptidyl-prolyl cis-trans isomerase D
MSVSKARAAAEPLILNEKKAQQIISSKFKGGNTIEQVAQNAGVSVLRADSVSFAQPFVPTLVMNQKLRVQPLTKALKEN